jgi:hypothetical protein
MPTIIAVNPIKKRKAKKRSKVTKRKTARKITKRTVSSAKKRKGKKTMPKKKRAKTKTRTKTVIKYRTRKNPTKKRRRIRRAIGATIAGVNLWGALQNTLPMLMGAMAAKVVAKKFADGGGELDNWTWKNYGLALLGGMLAAVGTSAIFKSKRSTAQRVMEGSLLLVAYKIVTNEIAPTNDTMEEWFGADDDSVHPDYLGADRLLPVDPTMGLGASDMLELPDGDTFVRGEDGNWAPTDDSHRMDMDMDGMGSRITPVNPTMGDDMDRWTKAYPDVG